jgi:hypothetical protein
MTRLAPLLQGLAEQLDQLGALLGEFGISFDPRALELGKPGLQLGHLRLHITKLIERRSRNLLPCPLPSGCLPLQ